MTHRGITCVTGASRGLGAAIANYYRMQSDECVLNIGRTLAGDWANGNVTCDFLKFDPDAVANEVLSHGDVCRFVLNAVHREYREVSELDAAYLEESFLVNLLGQATLLAKLLPSLRRNQGAVLLVGSHAADRFFEGGFAYSATKGCLLALAETLQIEERPRGVRTTLVSLGGMANRGEDNSAFKMSTESVAEMVARLLDAVPEDVVVGYCEMRPQRIELPWATGVARLSRV